MRQAMTIKAKKRCQTITHNHVTRRVAVDTLYYFVQLETICMT